VIYTGLIDMFLFLSDILGYMEYLLKKYPDMVSVVKIGKSSGGLPLKVLKISTPQAKNAGPKPAIWIDGGKFNKFIKNISTFL